VYRRRPTRRVIETVYEDEPAVVQEDVVRRRRID
jgi:hypothetical protein